MQLICYICREEICQMKKRGKIEKVYDFCPKCHKMMSDEFEEQFRKRKLRLLLEE